MTASAAFSAAGALIYEVRDRADDRRALLGGLGVARTTAAVVRVRAAVAAVACAADLLERPGASGGSRLELGLGPAHSGDLAGVGGEGLAAAAALLEAKSVARGVRVGGARGGGLLAGQLTDDRRSGCVGRRRRAVVDRRHRRGRRLWEALRLRAPGRPCCPCPLRPSAPESRCPCRACRSRSRCRCRCCPSEPDRAPGSVRAWCWWAALRAPRAPADPTCLRHRPCPRRCRCHSRSRCRSRCRSSCRAAVAIRCPLP